MRRTMNDHMADKMSNHIEASEGLYDEVIELRQQLEAAKTKAIRADKLIAKLWKRSERRLKKLRAAEKHNSELIKDWQQMFDEGEDFLNDMAFDLDYPDGIDLDFPNLRKIINKKLKGINNE